MANKTITMTDIARAAGVSKNTVSLALRSDPQIPADTRARIQSLAIQMGYQRNPTVAHLMAQLRASRGRNPRASLALVNAHPDPEAFKRHATIPTYVAGCRRRAALMGYGLDPIWLHDPNLNGLRLNRILKARGIRGIILVGLMKSNRLPEHFRETWSHYPCAVTGVRTRGPELSFACADHHGIALAAFEKAMELGYKRPGLVLDETIHNLVEGRFAAGYMIGQQRLPPGDRLQPFFDLDAAHADRTVFRRWLEKEQPDVVFTLYNRVAVWLDKLNYKIPRDIGLIQLEWRQDRPEFAGIHQHNDLAGEAAVDMVISMIHNGESGLPAFPRATLIGGTWMDGATVRIRESL